MHPYTWPPFIHVITSLEQTLKQVCLLFCKKQPACLPGWRATDWGFVLTQCIWQHCNQVTGLQHIHRWKYDLFRAWLQLPVCNHFILKCTCYIIIRRPVLTWQKRTLMRWENDLWSTETKECLLINFTGTLCYSRTLKTTPNLAVAKKDFNEWYFTALQSGWGWQASLEIM